MGINESENNFPKAPDQYTIITGEDTLIAEGANRFFDEILSFLRYNERAISAFTERQQWYLTIYQNQLPRLSEESYIRMLIVRDLVTASVLVVRNGNNWCQVSSAHYLTPNIIKRLREGIVES